MNRLTPQQVLFIHARLIADQGGRPGVRDLEYLESACERPEVVFNGIEIFPDVYSKAAGLLHALIDYHPFHEGNRRVALAAAAMFLKINGIDLKAWPDEAANIAAAVAAGGIDVTRTAAWLEKWSVS